MSLDHQESFLKLSLSLFTEAFSSHGGGIFRPDMDPVASTNIVMVYIDDKEKKVTRKK